MGRFDGLPTQESSSVKDISPIGRTDTDDVVGRFDNLPTSENVSNVNPTLRSLKLSSNLNPDNEAEASRLSQDKNITIPLARQAVRTGLSKGVPSHNTLTSPSVKKYIGNSPSNAAVSREDIENGNLLSVESAVSFDTRETYNIDGSNVIDENDPLDDKRLAHDLVPTYSLKEKTIRAAEVGAWNLRIGDKSYEQIFNDDPRIEEEIKTLESKAPEFIQGDNIFEEVATVSATMEPLVERSFVAGQRRGTLFAGSFATWAFALGQAGPQVLTPEEFVTVPAAGALGYGVGVEFGAAETIFKQEAGHFFNEAKNITDANGVPIDRNIVKVAALGYGSISTVMELASVKYLLKTVPGGEKLLGKLTKPAIKKALQNPTVIKRLAEIAVKLGKAVGFNALQEASQESAAVLSEELAKYYSTNKSGLYFIPFDWKKAFDTRVSQAGYQGALGGLGWGTPGTIAATAKVASDVNKSIKFQKQFDLVQENINKTITKQRSEEHARQYLKSTELQPEAFISPEGTETLFQDDAELANDILTKIGIDPVKAREKAALGQDITIDLALLHSKKLTKEEIDTVQNYLKPLPDSYTKKQIEAKAAAEDMELLVDRWNEQTIEQEKFQVEITRIKDEIVKAGFDEQFAQDNTVLLERVANRFALEGTDRTAFINSISIERKRFISKEIKADRIRKGLSVKTDPRGVLIIDKNNTGLHHQSYIVNLFSKANEATVAHELMGHIFLEEMDVISKKEGVSEQFKKDTKDVYTWLGAKEGEILNVKQKEKFARGFEQWLREGKAPTVELSSVFARFKNFLKSIYSSARKLNVKLNDNIIGVFNRLIDAENETRTAAALNGMVAITPAQMDALAITPERQEAMRSLAQTAMQKAEVKLFRAREKAVKANKDSMRAESTKEVLAEDTDDVYGMIDTIIADGLQFDRDEYNVSQGNPNAYKFLPSKRITKIDGVTLEDTAFFFGFGSTEEFVDSVSTTLPKDTAINNKLNEKTRVLENSFNSEDFITSTPEYLDYLTMLGEDIKDNKDRTKQATLTGKSKKNISREQIKKFARETLEATNVTDAKRPDIYLAAMKRASISQSKLIKSGDWSAALRENERVRLNHEMARLAVKNRDFVRKTLVNSTKSAKSKTVINSHREQVRSIVNRYKMNTTILPARPDKLVPLEELFKSTRDVMGFNAEEFLTNPKNRDYAKRYQDLRLEQFREVGRSIKYLTKIGREQHTQLLSDGVRRVDELVDGFILEMETGSFRKNKDNMNVLSGLSNFSRDKLAKLMGLDYVIKVLGGTSLATGELSSLEKNITEPLKDVRDSQHRLYKEKTNELKDNAKHIIDTQRELNKIDKGRLRADGVPVPEILQNRGRQADYFTAEQIFMMAGHRGSKSNIDALISGYPGLTIEHVDTLLNKFLSPADMDSIQNIRDIKETLTVPTQEVFLRLEGHEMSSVKAQPYVFKGKTYRGGFWHIDIDYNLSMNTRFLEKAELKTELEKHDLKYATPYTEKGHTNERVKHKMPISLNLVGVYKHFDKATRYITQAETVKDVDRLITDSRFTKTAIDVLGDEKFKEIRPALAAFANPTLEGYDIPGSTLTTSLRSIATAKNLTWFSGKFLTGPKQLGSISGAIHDMGLQKGAVHGFQAYMKGVSYVAAQPTVSHNIMIEKSAHMAQRDGKIDRDFLRPKFNKMTPSERALVWGDSEITWADARNLGFIHIKTFDRVASDPIWWGSYLDKLDEFGTNEKEAVRYADNIIQGSQPNVDPLTLPAWLRKGGFYSLFNMHQTYTVGIYGQRQRAYYGEWRAGRITNAQYAWFNFMDGILPAMSIQIMVALLRGKDISDRETWFQIAEATVAQWLTMGTPFIGSMIGALTQGWRDVLEIPGAQIVDDTFDTLNKLGTPLDEMSKDEQKRLFFRFVKLGGEYARVPVFGLAEQVIEEPTFRGKIFGTDYKVKKKQKSRRGR